MRSGQGAELLNALSVGALSLGIFHFLLGIAQAGNYPAGVKLITEWFPPEKRSHAIDILGNNAGCNIRKPAVEVTWEDWNTVLGTNLRGSFFVAQAIARGMIQRGYGRIINIGSVTSVAGYSGLGPYSASRGEIKQLTMSLADDWESHGITVNCLAPVGFVLGRMRSCTRMQHG